MNVLTWNILQKAKWNLSLFSLSKWLTQSQLTKQMRTYINQLTQSWPTTQNARPTIKKEDTTFISGLKSKLNSY